MNGKKGRIKLKMCNFDRDQAAAGCDVAIKDTVPWNVKVIDDSSNYGFYRLNKHGIVVDQGCNSSSFDLFFKTRKEARTAIRLLHERCPGQFYGGLH